MAKIPRINQSADRPSAVSGSVPVSGDSFIAQGLQALGGLAEAGAEIGINRELATQRKEAAELAAGRKILAEAMAAKKALVDESNAGRVSSEYETRKFQTLASVAEKNKNTPERILEDFEVAAADMRKDVFDRTDINDVVKMKAIKDVESLITSGRREAWSLANSAMTNQIKGNLAAREIERINGARGKGQGWLEDQYTLVDYDKDIDTVHGGDAGAYRVKLKSDMAAAQLSTLSEKQPTTARKLLESGEGFYGKYLDDKEFDRLYDKSKRDAFALDDTIMLDTLVKQGGKNTKLMALANGLKADAGVIALERDELAKRRTAIIQNPELTPEGKKAQLAELKNQNEFVDAVEAWQSRNTKSRYVGADEVPDDILIARDKILNTEEPSLSDIQAYRKMLLIAANDKRIPPGKFTAFDTEGAYMNNEATLRATQNTGWFPWSSGVKLGTNAARAKIESRTQGAPLSSKAEGKIYAEYVRLYTEAQAASAGKPLTRKDYIKFGNQAYYIATETQMPEGLR